MTRPTNPLAIFGLFLTNGLSLAVAFCLAGAGLLVATQGIGPAPIGLGIALALAGGLSTASFMEGYAALLHRTNPAALTLMRVLLVLSVPVNVVAFGVMGLPEGIGLQPVGLEETANTVGIFGWRLGGMVVLSVALLRPRPAHGEGEEVQGGR